MRRVLTALGVVAAVYIGTVMALWAGQRALLYLPDRARPEPAASGVPDMQVVGYTTSDGLALTAWYLPAQAGQPTIVYFHGNGGNIGYRGGRVRPFLDAGFGLLLAAYRGYGGNPGSPSEQGLYSDGRAALAYVTQDRGVPLHKLVLYGESLGSAVAVPLAAELAVHGQPVAAELAVHGQPVAAVVLEAPVSSVADVAAHHYPWVPVRPLLKDRFEAVDTVADVAAPLLIVHGTHDQVVPQRYGKALFAAAREPKEAVWLDGAGHENLTRFGLQQHVLEFLDRRLPAGVSGTP